MIDLRRLRRGPWLLGLLACGPPDRSLYMASLDVPADEAIALCQRIGDRGLSGDCQTHTAARLATTDPTGAVAICQDIGDAMWVEECFFLVADEGELTGDAAVTACRRAGRYRHNCLGHAIGREVRSTEHLHNAVGSEAALLTAITGVVARYKPGAPSHQQAATAETLTARIIAARWKDTEFDAALCGAADPLMCTRAYRTNLDATPPEIDIGGLCARPLTKEAIEAVGARAWADGSERVALTAWQELCDDLAAGRIHRDGQHGMGMAPRQPPPAGVLPGEVVP
jgi:hypothetical protein